MTGSVDQSVHALLQETAASGRRPIAVLLAPFTLIQYHRELVRPGCDLVSAITHVNVLHNNQRIPVTTSFPPHSNLKEGTVEVVSTPIPTRPSP